MSNTKYYKLKGKKTINEFPELTLCGNMTVYLYS